MNEKHIPRLARDLGIPAESVVLLQEALTHRTYAVEHGLKYDNKGLEFLGDSILGMVVAEYLYKTFPDRPEGELTRMRADMVCETSLAAIANQLQLGKHMLLGHGEEQGGGKTRPSTLADAVESVIAACYLDGGMAAAKQFVERFVLTRVPVTRLNNADYKTALQELVQQKRNQTIVYTLVEETGPDHDKHFTIELAINGQVVGIGHGTSKKRAEQDAARVALENWKK